MLDITIPNTSAKEFNFDEPNPVEIGIQIKDIKDMTKSLVSKDEITISYNPSDPTWLHLSANGVEKKVRCKNVSLMKRHKIPPVNHKWSMDLPWKQVKAFLVSCIESTNFEVLVNRNIVSFLSKSDDESASLDFKEEEEISLKIEGESISTILTPKTFMNLLSVSSAKTIFNFRGGENTVIETEWKEGGLILNGWIAPRT